MLAVRLDKQTEEKLNRLARETRRSKSYYVREAIAEYLAEKEDLLIALSRLEKGEKPLSTEELFNDLGWEVPADAASRGKHPKKGAPDGTERP